MPRFRPGQVKYVTNGSGAAYTHGQPVKEGQFVGVAIKQVAPLATAALSAATQIAVSEAYIIQVKGEVEVSNAGITGSAKGTPIYITSGNALTATSSSNTKFGVLADTAGTRGLPTGKCRIDLDGKDSFV